MLKFTFIILALFITQRGWASESNVNVEVKQSLNSFFASKPKVHGAIAELVRIQHWPKAKGKLRWSLPNLRNLPKRISLIAEQGTGKQLHRWYVSAEIRWMKDVVVLAHDVSARTMLDKSMLTHQYINVAGTRGQTWTDIDAVIGQQTLSAIHKGHLVHSSLVKRPPMIQRGDIVTILAVVAGIKIRAEGIALKSGSRGDKMLVKNTRSKQTLQSMVQDSHTVVVYAGGV